MRSLGQTLPGKDRVLRSEQIGLSGYKNEYQSGVLVANWVEERGASDFHNRSINTGDVNIGKTLNQTTYVQPIDIQENVYLTQQKPETKKDTKKEILFSHGSNPYETSYVTLKNLTHTQPISNIHTENALANMSTLKATLTTPEYQPTSLIEKKKREWEKQIEEERDISNTFKTVYHTQISSHDKKLNETNTSLNSTNTITKNKKWGEFTDTINKDHNKIGLREKYECKLSPLMSLGKKKF